VGTFDSAGPSDCDAAPTPVNTAPVATATPATIASARIVGVTCKILSVTQTGPTPARVLANLTDTWSDLGEIITHNRCRPGEGVSSAPNGLPGSCAVLCLGVARWAWPRPGWPERGGGLLGWSSKRRTVRGNRGDGRPTRARPESRH